MIQFQNKEFATKKELFAFLVENKAQLIAQKKAVKKEVDCSVLVAPVRVSEKVSAKKEIANTDPDVMKVVCVINTTNFLDSHNDLHLPGIWEK